MCVYYYYLLTLFSVQLQYKPITYCYNTDIQLTDIISTDNYALNIIFSFVKIDVIVRFMIATISIYGNSSARILMFYL